jgi:hypothetical protein
LNAVVPTELLHLSDELSGRRFLVDTGALYIIFPYVSPEQATGPFLKSPGGQNISCWGERRIEESFAGCRFEWDFVLAKVDFAIVGGDIF